MPLQGDSERPEHPRSHVQTIPGKHEIPGAAGNGTQDFVAKDRYKHCQSRSLCLQQLRTVTYSCAGCLKSSSLSLMIILSPPSPDLQFESGCGVTMPPDIAVLLKLCGKDQEIFRLLWILLAGQDVSGGFHSRLPYRMCWKLCLCLPCLGTQLPPAQFSPSAFLLPGSTALKNFALLDFDLNLYLLKKFETELHLGGGEIRK